MLTLNNYLKYDMTMQEYYITMDGVTNHTTYSSDELALVFGSDVNKAIKVICHSVYRLIYNHRQGIGKNEHIAYMRKKIYDNLGSEVNALMLAMIEAVKGAIESGMDLNAYTNEPKENLPYTVKDELRVAELLDSARKPITAAISYTLEEINATQAGV